MNGRAGGNETASTGGSQSRLWVIFTRRVSMGGNGSLSRNSFPAGRMLAPERVGHNRTWVLPTAALVYTSSVYGID